VPDQSELAKWVKESAACFVNLPLVSYSVKVSEKEWRTQMTSFVKIMHCCDATTLLVRCDHASSCFSHATDFFFSFSFSFNRHENVLSFRPFSALRVHRLRMRDIARIESMIRLDFMVIWKREIHLFLIFQNCSSLGYENAIILRQLIKIRF